MDATDVIETIEQIRRLRRVERILEPPMRGEIATAREFLERQVGPTIRPAWAAQALGVTHAALNRWLDSNDIASVSTPDGRREIPLSELLALLEHAEEQGVAGTRYPLATVLKARRRAAEEAIDVNRLLPRRRNRSHRAPETHALAYHRVVAERLTDELVEQARRRVARWRETGHIHPRWADQWEGILALPLTRIAKAIAADTERGRELRQTSPFTGVLNAHERQRLVEAVEERLFA